MGVLLHNTIPHLHMDEETDHAETHQHHHSDHDHHHEDSSENSAEDPHSWLDLASLLTHANLGVNHFSDFNSPGLYFFTHPVVIILLLLGSLWPLLLLYQVIKPPGNEHDKRLQLLYLSATSRRGPPSFS